MTFTQVRNQIDTLMRKYAREVAIYRLQPVATKIAQLWEDASDNQQPLPDPHSCVRIVADANYRLPTFMDLHIYLRDCKRSRTLPDANEIAEKLFPPPRKPIPSP